MLTIISVTTDERVPKSVIGLSVGAVISVCSFIGGPFTGASMNPARSLGPAIMANDYTSIVIYIMSPIIGALLGLYIYKIIEK